MKNDVVHNISSITLSRTELNVLNKGLDFCPKEKMNVFVLKQDLYRFYRQLRFKAYFSGLPTAITKEFLPLSIKNMALKSRSVKVPPTSCSAVEVYIEKVDSTYT